MKILILLSLVVMLNAKVIEVKQLFSKKIIEVQTREIAIEKSFYGVTKIDESLVYDVVLRYDGFINQLFANRLYQPIKKSQKLLNLYSQEVANIQEELIVAKKLNHNLYKSLKEKLILLDIDKSIVDKISNKALYDFDIYSPIDGVIIHKNINNGSFVKKGKLLLQIANLSQLWAVAKVYQRDISFIKIGMSALVDIEGFGTIKSKIDFIYPTLNPKSKTIDVRLLIDNSDLKIYPNLFTKIKLLKPSKNMLILPRSAVFTKGETHYIFKPLNDREFEPVEIEARRINSKEFEIISGLSNGDKVIDKVMFMLDSDAITNGLYEDEDW